MRLRSGRCSSLRFCIPQASRKRDGASRAQCTEIIENVIKRTPDGRLVKDEASVWYQETVARHFEKFRKMSNKGPVRALRYTSTKHDAGTSASMHALASS